MRSRSTWIAMVVVLSLVDVGRAQGQGQPDPNLSPTYGSVTLKPGFRPDPYTVELQAGGELRTNLGGVNAYVARAPDFSVHYTKGSQPLIFHVKSVGDTTLLINLPDGTWIADDDSGGDLDPLIRIDRPRSGRYDIYVGTYRAGLLAATLHITEKNPLAEPPPTVVDKYLPSCYVVSAGVDNYRNANKLSGCLNDARNTVAALRGQVGRKFSKVEPQTLLDAKATRGNILQQFQDLAKKGAARDFMVLFLSGHGGRTAGNKTWYFLPVDFHPDRFADTGLTDRQILDAADGLVEQQKNVVIIVDACFCGQMYHTAEPYLRKYKTADAGSMTLMLSSAADQTSAALGNYSAFAKAFYDAISGAGDLNKDGKITLGEIKTYTLRRTAQLLVQSRMKEKQDCIVAWSSSLSSETPLALKAPGATGVAGSTPAAPSGTPTRWVGLETLADYGKLSFAMYPGGKVVMVDARQTTEGIWRKTDNRFTLSFDDGAVVYTGTLKGGTLSGTATSPSPRTQAMRTWKWSVTRQATN
jgi:hypothetical protein